MTSSQPDFLAKTSAAPENKQDLADLAAPSSTKSSAWLGTFNLNSSSLKMLQISCLTPTGRRSKKSSTKLPKQGLMQSGQLYQLPMWEPATAAPASGSLPTPRTCSAITAPVNTKGNLEGNRFPNLETVIGRMLPTPTTRDHKDGSQQSCANVAPNGLLGREIHQAVSSPLTGDPMYLNPSFVEEMMGFPVGWTA